MKEIIVASISIDLIMGDFKSLKKRIDALYDNIYHLLNIVWYYNVFLNFYQTFYNIITRNVFIDDVGSPFWRCTKLLL